MSDVKKFAGLLVGVIDYVALLGVVPQKFDGQWMLY